MRGSRAPPTRISRKRVSFLIKHNRLQQLKHRSVRNVSFDRDFISFEFDGEIIRNKIVIVPHEYWVGGWSRSKNEVYIDDDVPEKYRRSLAAHESIEKFLYEEYGLSPDAEGHEIAEILEKKVTNLNEKEWEEYSKAVERIHRAELSRIEGKPYKHIIHR